MKNILITFFLALLTSCDNNQTNSTKEKPDQSEKVNSNLVKDKISIPGAIDSIQKKVYKYKRGNRHGYPNLSKETLLKLRKNDPDTLFYYLNLLLLKKGAYHLECCNQGYELRSSYEFGLDTTKDKVLYEYLKICNPFEERINDIDSLTVKKFEFMNSLVVPERCLQKNEELLKYDSIRYYFNKINGKD